MSHLNKIFAVWDDNAEALAADIDEKGVTVRQWRNRGDIPSRSAQLKIIRAAFEKNGTVLKLEDFLSPAERLALPCHGLEDRSDCADASATKAAENIGAGDASAAAANNSGENIRGAGEADSHGPFSAASRSICSTTQGSPNMPAASPTSSSSPEVRAA